ncbi:MAG TPA: 3-deoxy-D-manno-octulosonic acid transferase [Verrucomicrobia bacterium]|nr:3-deoxy-D-manno-octulosonic acid transferase [Verrucomicrobiales bacterium]HIL54739.1 3-deoxy-D-manno-octulosonic acid transferase [Verrucomicrobiota bacterium]
MRVWIILLIYNLILPLILLGALPGYALKIVRRGNYGNAFGERFGFFSRKKRQILLNLDNPLWIHAVSVGEVNIAKKLILSIKRMDPTIPIVLSTTTPTGASIAHSSEASVIIYHPLDFLFVSTRVFDLISPRALILTEAEVWPNLVNKSVKRGVEVSLINARLSQRSKRRFKQFSFFTKPIFSLLSRVCVQQESDIKSWESMGVSRHKVFLTGSIKFDSEGINEPNNVAALKDLLNKLFGGKSKKVILAGSTHPGEESLIGKVHLELRDQFPDLYYLVAPRHVERRHDLVNELRNKGLNPVLRTELESQETESLDSYDCLVIDTTGELNAWYYASDIVVIGKSFLANGGQNPVEAIFANKPVLVGPNMQNFASLTSDLKANGGVIQVEDEFELIEKISEFLANPEIGVTLSQKANLALSLHKGASDRTAKLIIN